MSHFALPGGKLAELLRAEAHQRLILASEDLEQIAKLLHDANASPDLLNDRTARLLVVTVGYVVGSEKCAAPEELFHQAQAFVTTERRRFQEAGQQKLFERYSRLARYLDTRAHLWSAGN